MNLINEKVQHITLGLGTIISQNEKYITIEFPAQTCTFQFPMAFEKYLSPQNPMIAEEISSVLATVKANEEAAKAKAFAQVAVEATRKKESTQRNKSTQKSNIVSRTSSKKGYEPTQSYFIFQADGSSENPSKEFLWTPLNTKETGTFLLRKNFQAELLPGDIIFYCCNNSIYAVGIIRNSCANNLLQDDSSTHDISRTKTSEEICCEWHLLRNPHKCDEASNSKLRLCKSELSYCNKKHNLERSGTIFELNRKYAIRMLEDIVCLNNRLFNIAELSWILCGLPTITNLSQLWDNCNTLDTYLSSHKDPEYSFALNLIKRGTCFVAIETNGTYRFYPSRFVGYQENTMTKHESNGWKDGKETNPAIGALLGIGTPVSNAGLDAEYGDYCRHLGFEPQDKGTFDVTRKFWDVRE